MKTVIEMAHETLERMKADEHCREQYWSATDDELQAFAELVRADERNRTWTQEHWTEYERSIAAAEREACAKVCDELRGINWGPEQCATAIRARMAEQSAQQEPVAMKWQQAPIRTVWGDDMVVASVAIDNDHTLSLYCERDQTPKVDAMFAQRTWVGLEKSDMPTDPDPMYDHKYFTAGMVYAANKLMEKNT